MSTTTMHFGPEWMRSKQQPQVRPPSPPPANNIQSGTSTYSALVSATPTGQADTQDEVHPFRYTKEELLRIFKESPKASLGLEVERWEGVVRELGSDPIALREMGEGEKKLFAGPLNSDLRRRQSTDYLSPLNVASLGTERNRLNHNSPGSPLRERYPGLKRRDSNADSPTATLTRKQSLSALQSPSTGARTAGAPSPRVRQGFTGGFDGVLGAGETWSSRRRTSEASLRPSTMTRESSGGPGDNGDKLGSQGEGLSQGVVLGQGRSPTSSQVENTQALNAGLSPRGQINGAHEAVSFVGDPTVPAEPKDLAAVEWSYKDPSGNVQGPFRADLMQKWFDDGYFAPNLPMKRVQYDPDWITVAELTRRTTSGKIFLSTLRPIAPPGLTKREASPPDIQQVDQNIFSNPYQPAPMRSLRSANLDSFHGSNPSDSPSSSIGHFGNNSPDPLAFGGMGNNANHYTGEATNGLGFTGGMDVGGLRRTQLQEFAPEPHRLHSPSYGNLIGGQNYNPNGHPFTGPYNAVQASPWGTPSHDPFTALNGNYNGVPTFAGQPGFNAQLHQINLLYGHAEFNQAGAMNHFNTAAGTAEQQNYGNIPQGYGVQQHYQHEAKIAGEKRDFSLRQDDQLANSVHQANTSAPWQSSVEIPARRTGPFDAPHPTTLNTSVPPTSSQPSPWAQPPQTISSAPQSAVPKDASPWLLASQGVLDTPWAAPVVSEPPSLERLVEEPATNEHTVLETTMPGIAAEPSPPPSPIEEPVPAEPAPAPVPKSAKKNKTAPTPLPAGLPAAFPAVTLTISAQKSAWSKDDKKKSKSSGATISLREIQDAEAKAADARKEKDEKDRANRHTVAALSASDSKEDIQPFTASWGLPTSQAGGRSSSQTKDAPSVTPGNSSPVPPVWTNASKASVVKKTMKEIQEEEERRKKTVAKETIAAAAKRAYADFTPKAAPSSATMTSGSAWVTVGSSGKTNTAVTAPPRPSVASVAATSSSSSLRPNGMSVVRSTVVQSSASKPSPSPTGGKVEDFPVSPSHEFLKWLTESLKGLNSSVNVEEIISMLLSFSLDPDPLTIEIIQETIYANSTTLDGRRFAAEFVSKRKADAAGRKSGNGSSSIVLKSISIAEVVKATPKSAQSEWGFKVVNKKKKGGRS